MTDTSGPTFYAPLGKWDRDSQSWKTSEATSLWALTLSSLTLPAWGGLHDGELCELPTPALAISALDSSSLPTPTKGDGEGGGKRVGVTWEDTTKSTAQGGASRLRDVAGLLATLPTPTASDTNGAGPHGEGGADLRTTIAQLPTPTSRDWEGHNQRGDDTCLTGALLPTPTSQAAKHGELSPIERKGNSPQDNGNLWRMLPTPSAADGMGGHATRSGTRSDEMLLPGLAVALSNGATTAPPSPDGSTPSDDPHPHLLSLDGLAHPA